MSRPIYRASLGRIAKLGSLYDIRTDSFLHDTLFKSDPDEELVETIEPGGTEIDLVLTDNLQEKFNKLNVEAELQMSCIVGLVKSLKGSGAYISENRKSARARSMSLVYNIKTIHEDIAIRQSKGIIDMDILNADDQTTDATHVVVGIEWGAICAVTCEYESSQDEDLVKVDGALKTEISKLKAVVSLNNEAKAEYGDQVNESHTKFTFKCISDVIPSDEKLPGSFDEAVNLARNLPRLVKDTNNGKGVPLTYILKPLQSVRQMFKLEAHIQKQCTAIDEEIIKKCTQIAEGITRKRQALYDIQTDLHASRDYLGEGSLRKIDEILETFDVGESSFKSKLQKLLKGIRSGEKDVSSLWELISAGLPVATQDSKHTSQIDSFQNDLRKARSITSLKGKGIVFIGKKDDFRVDDMDKGYIMYRTGNTEYKEICDKSLELFLRLKKTHGKDCRFVIVDINLREDLCPTSTEKPTIHRIVDGVTKCIDVLAKEGEDLKMCLVKVDSPVLISMLPSDRAPVKLRCPNALIHDGECPGDPIRWKCSKCKELVEYSITNKRFYCGCGQSSTRKPLFRCNEQHHGMEYVEYPVSILDNELAGQRPREETNILILGETGVGKSTWINGFMNYVYFRDMEDAVNSDEFHVLIPSKFNFIQDGVTKEIHVGGSDSNECFEAGESATQEPRGYIFHVGDHLIRLIDTPGIGDSRGIEQDKTNFDSILSYLTYYEEIHAVCIILKPNNARLNVVFRFCIQELLSHLHASIKHNIVFCFTNARSTFYQPGDTLPPLNKELRNRNVGIQANQNNTFCFDSESFRFLACLKNGVTFNEGEIKTYAESWNKSVETTGYLLRHIIRGLTPKKVKDTTTLNEARRIIVAMSKPLTEVSKIILENVASGESAQEQIALGNKDMVDMQMKLKCSGFDLVRKELGYPRTVCTVYDDDERKSCVRHVPVGETGVQNQVYQQICHERCYLTGIHTQQTNDLRLSNCSICCNGHECHVCGHHYTMHMHLTYDTEIVKVEFLSKEVQKQINSKKKKVDQIKAFRKAIQKKNDELMAEQAIIIKTSARFGSFLKANALIPYNDAVGDYLEISIHEEQMKPVQIRSDKKLDAMRKRKFEYQKEKEILDQAISDGATTNMATELSDIMKLHGELFELKHMGHTLKKLFNGASISQSANNIHFQERIAPIAPIARHKPYIRRIFSTVLEVLEELDG